MWPPPLRRFAGAGLFESHPSQPPAQLLVDYSAERVVADAGFRAALLWRIAVASVLIEQLMGGGAQDIEGGVTADCTLYVMQARPQV